MTTVVLTRNFARTDALAAASSDGNVVQVLYFQGDVTTAFASSDTVDIGYLPAFAVPVGGYVAAVDIDTGTETLDLDLGIAANGVDSADPDFFMNGGVFEGDAISAFMPLTNSANYRPLTGPFPVVQLGAKTKVQLLCNAVAQAGGTGKFVVCVYYITPGKSTS